MVDLHGLRRCRGRPGRPAAHAASAHRHRCMSEVEQVGDFDDEGALHELARRGVAPIVVDDVDVAERVVHEIETQVGADLVRVGVVLDERVEEGAGAEAA